MAEPGTIGVAGTPTVSTIPFVVRRRVNWGETDPAGIVYTARFLDYAVEAAEAWYIRTVGYDWYGLRTKLGMGSPMAHASLDFLKPLRPAEEFTVAVLVEALGRSSVTLQVLGRNLAGDTCFRGKRVAVLIDAGTDPIRSHPFPPEFRQRIEDYQAACRAAGQA